MKKVMGYVKYLYPTKVHEFFCGVLGWAMLILGVLFLGKKFDEASFHLMWIAWVLAIIATVGFYFVPIGLFFKFCY